MCPAWVAASKGADRSTVLTLPPMPEIGHSENYYANLAHRAHKQCDLTARDAHKVGHYVTLALNKHLLWPEKLRYFKHALDHHCIPPPFARDKMLEFYRDLTATVRKHCGAEALRMISAEDDTYAKRLPMTHDLEVLFNECERFFAKFILSEECPDWFESEDYEAMKLMRNQWI